MANSLNRYQTTLLICIILFFISCLDEYNPPQIQNSERILVVEGNIGDKETNIRLSRTNNLSSNTPFPVYYARVILEKESDGTDKVLEMIGDGLYHAKEDLNIGERYRVLIQDGDYEYVSEYLELLETPQIDSVGWEDNVGLFQVHVSTHDKNNDTRYYLWRFKETWVYNVISNSDIYGGSGENREYEPCWTTEASTSVQIGTTINLTKDIIFKQPIHVIEPTTNLKLSKRYSILVKQYALSKEAYGFWQLLKKNTEGLGTFFDPLPSQLPTNITCIEDSDRPVIGFLSASSEQQKRMFVNKRDLPYRGIPFATSFGCRGSREKPNFWRN